jgi:hypothetical protein
MASLRPYSSPTSICQHTHRGGLRIGSIRTNRQHVSERHVHRCMHGITEVAAHARRYHAAARTFVPVRDSVVRLALILQNFHHLMIRTEQYIFDACLADLFRRFFRACYLTVDSKRAMAAWDSARSVGLQRVLQDNEIAMNYVETLLSHRDGSDINWDMTERALTCELCLSLPRSDHSNVLLRRSSHRCPEIWQQCAGCCRVPTVSCGAHWESIWHFAASSTVTLGLCAVS